MTCYSDNHTNNAQQHIFCRLALAGALTIGLALSAAATAQGYNATSAEVHYVNTTGNGSVVNPVSAQYNYPLVSGTNSGHVGLSGTNPSGVPMIATGAYASSANGGWVQTQTQYTTSLLVGSGTSGLTIGTAVTLQLGLLLHGNTSVTSGEDAAYTNMSFNLSIDAPDQATYDPGKGWYVPTIADFSANVDNSVNNFFTYFYGDPNGAWYHSAEYSAGWGWNSNLASGSGGDVNYYDVNPGLLSTTDANFFNTGIVLIDFQTYVGDTLNIFSFFDTWGDTYGTGSSATSDFLNTMQAAISSPYASGLNLIYGSTQVVPVPAAVWLFGSALLGLIGMSRRQSLH